MGRFNRKEFGEKLKEFRKAKGYSLDNIANALNKTSATVSRYESGEILPDIETLSLICDELRIEEYELFNDDIQLNNIENSKNPFGVKTLYLYYKTYSQITHKFGRGKFKLNIIEKPNCCEVDFVDYKTNKIYMSGHIVADGNIAVFILENYKPNSPRLEVTEIILNISDCMDKFMFGSLHCTNAKYVPNVRKCIISKFDFEHDDKMAELLKLSDYEKKTLNEEDILYLNIDNIDDYES